MTAVLVAFAGIDGSGKTTQAMLLADRLAKQTRSTFVPNKSLRGLREALDAAARKRGAADHVELLGGDTARLLAAAAKWMTLETLREELASGPGVVVTDRGIVCQYALARSFGPSHEGLVRDLFDDLQAPACTIFLDADPDEAATRIDTRGIDHVDAWRLRDLAAAYRSLPEFAAFDVIDAGGGVDVVHEAVYDVVVKRLGR